MNFGRLCIRHFISTNSFHSLHVQDQRHHISLILRHTLFPHHLTSLRSGGIQTLIDAVLQSLSARWQAALAGPWENSLLTPTGEVKKVPQPQFNTRSERKAMRV